jgi:hypothetical protein
MTLRPQDPKQNDETIAKPISTNDDAEQRLPDLAPRKPDAERDEQVKGGRVYIE